MSITYGVTPQGFVAKPLDVIKSELDAKFKAGPLGSSAGTESDGSIPAQSLAGQIIAIMVDGLAGQWDLQQAVYSGFDPGQAVDAAQDAVCSITGTVRDPAVNSLVTATCTGDPGTILLVGRAATVQGSTSRFSSQASATDPAAPASTLAVLSSWLINHGYAVGDRVTNASRAYECITAGLSAGAGGPTTTAADITDNTVHWTYLGEGTAAVDVVFKADIAGPIGATARNLTVISTPVSGWKSIINLHDAVVGALLETSSALRIRRDAELHADGNAVADAVRSRVLRVGEGTVNNVTACTVFYNDTDAPNADGVPAHAIEVLVLGGQNQAIADAIWSVAGGSGIYLHGSTVLTVSDSQGNVQTVRFSRPTAVPIYIVADVTYDNSPGVFPTNGGTLIQSALATFGAAYTIGRDVRSAALGAAVFDAPSSSAPGATPVPGILDATCKIGLAPAPALTIPITITSRQIATFDTSRITVNLTGAAP